MYRDDTITVVKRSLTNEELARQTIRDSVTKYLVIHGSPYVVSYVDFSEYPRSITVRAVDESLRQPDENDLGVDDEGYDKLSEVFKKLATLTGARWVGFPTFYWSK